LIAQEANQGAIGYIDFAPLKISVARGLDLKQVLDGRGKEI
jgi:hypothetical protein